jgi:hypothetical protein
VPRGPAAAADGAVVPAVHEYLSHLEAAGFEGSPRVPRPFQDRFEGGVAIGGGVLRSDHERRVGRGNVTKLR